MKYIVKVTEVYNLKHKKERDSFNFILDDDGIFTLLRAASKSIHE